MLIPIRFPSTSERGEKVYAVEKKKLMHEKFEYVSDHALWWWHIELAKHNSSIKLSKLNFPRSFLLCSALRLTFQVVHIEGYTEVASKIFHRYATIKTFAYVTNCQLRIVFIHFLLSPWRRRWMTPVYSCMCLRMKLTTSVTFLPHGILMLLAPLLLPSAPQTCQTN